MNSDFVNVLKEVILEYKDRIRDEYSSTKGFSELFNIEILGEVASRLEIREFSNEYKYSIKDNNTLFWMNEYRKYDFLTYRMFLGKDKFNFWKFETIVEHENDKNNWFQEFVKLLNSNAKEKIIFGYEIQNKNNVKKDIVLTHVDELLKNMTTNDENIFENDNMIVFLGSSLKSFQANKIILYKCYRLDKKEGKLVRDKLSDIKLDYNP